MKKRKFIPYKRKAQGKTNYRKRLSLLKSKSLRLVVRKSLRNIKAQLVEYGVDGDKTLITATSEELKEFGWNRYRKNVPAAYLVGALCATKAKKAKIETKAVLDIGLNTARKGTVLFAVLKGAVEAGLEVPHDPKMFPSEDRIVGKHISEDVAKTFEQVKTKIQGTK
jgi:large subunit ribosomal protein L18